MSSALEALVAQLDRASVFGTEGYRFDSCRVHWIDAFAGHGTLFRFCFCRHGFAGITVPGEYSPLPLPLNASYSTCGSRRDTRRQCRRDCFALNGKHVFGNACRPGFHVFHYTRCDHRAKRYATTEQSRREFIRPAMATEHQRIGLDEHQRCDEDQLYFREHQG